MNQFGINSMTAGFGHIYQCSIVSKLHQTFLTNTIYLDNHILLTLSVTETFSDKRF